jgi:Na+/melibiose symporter-like transporter
VQYLAAFYLSTCTRAASQPTCYDKVLQGPQGSLQTYDNVTMQKRLYITSRVIIVISIFVWLATFASIFGFFAVRNLPGYNYFQDSSAILFPFAVLGLLFTTPAVNSAVKVLKWLIGITLAISHKSLAYFLGGLDDAESGRRRRYVSRIFFRFRNRWRISLYID